MIPTQRAIFLAGAALLAARVVFGCATEDNSDSPVVATDGGDLDVAKDAGDASTDDASDAAALGDADADAAPRICSADEWCYTALPEAGSFDAGPSSGPTYGPTTLFQLTSVWTGSDHVTWAVTSGGHILRWNGSWTVVTVLGMNLHTIFGTSPADLWIGGDNALLLHGTVSAGGLTLSPVTFDNVYESFTAIWGTSATNLWVLGNNGDVFHSAPADAGAGFTQVNLPSDYPGDYNYFRATALWGKGTDVWVAGMDQTYCTPVTCEAVAELVVRKWLGGNLGEASWDRVRIPMNQTSTIPQYSNITLGGASTDGVEVAFIDNGGYLDGHVFRVSTTASQLTTGLDGVHHDGAYTWTLEATPNFVGPQGLWVADSKNVWLAGPGGVRHWDGVGWQIGRLSIVPDEPLLKDLHGIHGVVPPGAADLWSVGDDVALHRTVSP